MKHPAKVTTILLCIFLVSQFIGLFIIGQYIDIETTSITGNTTVNQEKYFIQPPEVENESSSWLLLLIPIFIGTIGILLLMKFKLFKVWKAWFFLSIFLALFIAIHPFTSLLINSFLLSAIIAAVAAYYKVKKPNVWVHNTTELLLYGGIAALFVPILNVTSGIILLIVISIYDMIAVWFSKHMVAMAKFQTENHAFAGVHIPSSFGKKQTKIVTNKKSTSTKPTKTKAVEKGHDAILGGGDIAFPLLFAGTVLKSSASFYLAGIISIGALVGLSILFMISKKGKFYPAMPFISFGCFVAFGIIQFF